MIKKAQIQFICITMAILLGVFTVMFGISYYIMRNTQEFAIEKTLVDTEQAFIAVNEAAL